MTNLATDGLGTILSGIEGGGTVIPPLGTLDGVYDGSVTCDGDVTVTGPLEVKGSMVILGDFINDGGYPVLIRGDLFAQAIEFNHSDPTQPQSNFQVDGDLIFTFMNFIQTGNSSALLRVGGNLIGSFGGSGSILDGSGVAGSLGVSGTNGLSILVYGDVVVADIRIFGGENLAGDAGAGGSIVVYGDCLVASNLDVSGGYAENGDAGNGGSIDIYGNLSVPDGPVYVRGGNAINGNAGNAGNINVDSNFTGSDISAYGGNCDSMNGLHRSGSGGYINVYGQVTWANSITVSGGDRSGIVAVPGGGVPPDAGVIDVRGGISCSDINARGGSVYASGAVPHNAGNGGSLYINGPLYVSDDLQFEGGFASIGSGGSGGYIDVEGPASIEDDFDMNGGYASAGNGGNGGTAYFYSDLGLDEVRMQGGDGNNGNGGYGAYLFVKGSLSVNEFYNGSGGGCSSTFQGYIAGAGGTINVEGDFLYFGDDDILNLNGGYRNGATTILDLGGAGANGGTILVGGNFTSRVDVELNGGNVITDYPNAAGGNGGNLTVEGDFRVSSNIYMNGGSCIGNTAGDGGSLVVRGHGGFISFSAVGGNSNESVVLGDAGRAGRGGFASFLYGVAATDTIDMRDGVPGPGGTAAIGIAELRLGGYCSIAGINMETAAYIRPFPFGGAPVIMKLDSLPTKNTLNWADGTATGDVSALVPSNMFITNSGVWYSVAGTLVP